MKLWQQQASGTAKSFINFSNVNKRIFVCFDKPIMLGLLNYIWVNHQNIYIDVFGFHYAWYVKTAAAADNICINLYMLFILYVTALEFNITIPFSLSVPGFAGCVVWISQLVQLYFLCFQGIVNRIYLGSFLGYFPPCTLLQYR